MATSPAIYPEQKQLEDPLLYLPCSTISEYRKGHTIYDRDRPSKSLFLVIDGKVKVCRVANEGRQVVVDLYSTDDFFGESALLSETAHETQQECAIAFENTKVMSWTATEIERLVTRCPRLAVALLQLVVERSVELVQRVESLSVDNNARRLALALIRFSERLGHRSDHGAVEMMPFTHDMLSQYVGTTREFVTSQMNQFRRQGYLDYSRKGIWLHADSMKDWLRRQPA